MPSDILAPLRRVRVAAVVAIPAVAALVLVTADADSTVPAVLPVLLVALTGLAAIAGAVLAERVLWRQRPTADEAGGTLRAHSYLQLAIAEFPLLLSVALAYVLGPTANVLIGAVTALAALAVGFPSTARVRRLEAHWDLPPASLTGAAVAPGADDKDPPR